MLPNDINHASRSVGIVNHVCDVLEGDMGNLVVVDEPVKPVLFQHLTDIVSQMLLQNHFKVLHVTEEVSSEITANESSAL